MRLSGIALGIVAFVVSGSAALADPVVAYKPDEAQPLWQAEVRIGAGVEIGGSGARMTTRSAPVTFEAIASFAINDEPRIMGFGGLIAEMYNRNAAGATGGVTFSPEGTNLRLSGGGIAFIAPYSLVGATASGGICRKRSSPLRLCGDVQITEYFAGSDLADGHAVTQIQLVFGAVFDVL